MKLLVGLGNPGPEYAWSRHNLGYLVVACLSKRLGIPLTKKHLKANWGQGQVDGEPVVLAQPVTYMNLSGLAVKLLLQRWRLSTSDLIVVHDDLDVPWGRLKLAGRGGAAGHRGILSIIAALETEDFFRVKLGIGRPPPGILTEVFVLSPFLPEERETMAALVDKAAQAVITLVTAGLAAAQNEFHRVP
jgi:PTH1 family peptidyl-tRNA hydrolase